MSVVRTRMPIDIRLAADSRESVDSRRPVGRHRLRSRPGTLVATLLGVLVLLVVPVAAASAHVRVHPDSLAAGSFSALTFRVPTESATASTVSLEVQLPQDTPFLSVSVKPVDGWTAKVTQAALPKPVTVEGTELTKAARTVTWTADDTAARIAPGQYQEFSISVGPLPAAGTTIMLPARQTYSDGTVVDWNEPTPASGTEPEHPAPSFTVTSAAAAGGSTTTAPDPASTDGSSSGAGSGSLWVAIAALVVAVLGAALGGVALLATRRAGMGATS